MQISVIQALLLGFGAYVTNSGIFFGWMFLNIMSRPLIICFLIGLIMGDMPSAMAAGVLIQGMYLGQTSIGGVSSMPQIGMSMWFGVPFAMIAGGSPEEVAALALTICLACSAIETPLKSLANVVKIAGLHQMDALIGKGKLKQGMWCAYIWQQGLTIVQVGIPVVLLCLMGQDIIVSLASTLPAWVGGCITTFTSLLRMLGFSLLMMSLLKHGSQWLLFLFGFALVKGMGISVLSLTFIALGIAYLVFLCTGEKDPAQNGLEV